MAHAGGHAVLVIGLRSGTPPELLWGALVGAGHMPLAIGCPAGMLEQGRCYVTFREQAEADSVCGRHGSLRLYGRALTVTRLFGSGWGPGIGQADAALDGDRSTRPALPPPARAAAHTGGYPAVTPQVPLGPASRPAPTAGEEHSVLIRGLRSGTHPGHIWDTLVEAGLRPLAVHCPGDSSARGRCVVTFREQAEAVRAGACNGALR